MRKNLASWFLSGEKTLSDVNNPIHNNWNQIKILRSITICRVAKTQELKFEPYMLSINKTSKYVYIKSQFQIVEHYETIETPTLVTSH